jgi:hypothetical protein
MSDLREQFKAAGFEVVDGGSVSGSLRVRKYGFVRYLEPRADQQWLALGPPYFQVRGLDCELEDKGYQKFWRHGDTRFPIRKTDLLTLHRFDEEVRQILRLPSLYNESLGSTCAQTDYDRLEGRPDR